MKRNLMSEMLSYGKMDKIKIKGMDLSFVLIENPGKIISNICKKKIFKEFYQVALSAFGQNDSNAFEKDVFSHMFDVNFLVLVFNNEVEGVAFRTYSRFNYGEKIIHYIEGTAVRAEYQSLGIYQSITKATLAKVKVDYVVARTQNPIVVKALSKLFSDVYPVTKKPNKEIKDVALHVSNLLGMKNYEYDNLVGRTTYGGQLTSSPPSAGRKIDGAMFSQMNPQKGDSVLAVCVL